MSATVATPTTQAAVPPQAGAARTGVRRGAALALLVSAQFVVMLDTSIVNVALPSIQRDLHLGTSGLAWVVNAYVLTFGGLLLLAGRVGDLIGYIHAGDWTNFAKFYNGPGQIQEYARRVEIYREAAAVLLGRKDAA